MAQVRSREVRLPPIQKVSDSHTDQDQRYRIQGKFARVRSAAGPSQPAWRALLMIVACKRKKATGAAGRKDLASVEPAKSLLSRGDKAVEEKRAGGAYSPAKIASELSFFNSERVVSMILLHNGSSWHDYRLSGLIFRTTAGQPPF